MSKTKSQVGILALKALKAVEGDGTADSNDVTTIEDAYDQVYERLRNRHLVSWGSTGSIPNGAVPFVVALVAESQIGTFNPPQSSESDIRLKASTAFLDLAEIIQPDYVSIPVPAEYY